MIEAVGHAYFDTFFGCCSKLLKPDGAMLLQAITIADQRYEASRKTADFMSRYIFPGGCLPSVSVICRALARATDMALVHMEDLTAHYVRTLAAWRSRFFENLDRIRALGYPDSFLRMWEFYLCYCEAAFAERATADSQMLFLKPSSRGISGGA
jgi:cyclopropane-fatty-acyl-phospholipid synthase